jgi:SAM-dependent methyltransferase
MHLLSLVLLVAACLACLARKVANDRIVARVTGDDAVEEDGGDARWLGDLYSTVVRNAQYQIEADYERKDITDFDSYNAGMLRRYPTSSPHEAALELAGLLERRPLEVLDLGCGTGNFAAYACARNPLLRFTCVTNSASHAEIARRTAVRAGVGDRVAVLRVDFDDWTPPVGSYDRIVSLESLGYSRDRPALLRALHAALRPGGLLYVKTPTFRSATMHGLEGVSWGQAAQLIGVWQYDFSTPASIARDVRAAGFSGPLKACSYPMWLNVLFTNPVDWISFMRFMARNGCRWRDHFVSMDPWHPLQVTHMRATRAWSGSSAVKRCSADTAHNASIAPARTSVT